MLKKDLEKQIQTLNKELNDIKQDVVNKGLQELILEVIRTKLTFNESEGNIIIKVDGEYLDSFYIGEH